MKRNRLRYLIVSLIIMSLTLSLSLYYPENSTLLTLSYIFIIFFGVSSFNKKRNEVYEIRSYLTRYLTDYQITPFLDNIKDFEKKCIFFTKKQKRSFLLYYAQAYIDKGDFKKAEELLLEIDLSANKFNRTTRFIYLLCWCDMLFYQNRSEKMNYTINKLSSIVDREKNPKIKANYIQNLQLCYWKYHILNNTDLQLINQELTKINIFLKDNPIKKRRIEFMYLLGIVNLKLKNFNDGINCLEQILKICNYNNVYLVRKSNKLISEYKRVIQTTIGEDYLLKDE